MKRPVLKVKLKELNDRPPPPLHFQTTFYLSPTKPPKKLPTQDTPQHQTPSFRKSLTFRQTLSYPTDIF